MRKLRNGIVIVLLIVSCIGQLLAEVYHTFNSNRLRAYCGESGKTGLVNIRQEVDINEPFAVALGWTISANGLTRYYYTEQTLTVGGLDYYPHNGNGGGYNEIGFQVIIERSMSDNGNYVYSQHSENVYPSKPCIDNE